jgi:hypothetical protein
MYSSPLLHSYLFYNFVYPLFYSVLLSTLYYSFSTAMRAIAHSFPMTLHLKMHYTTFYTLFSYYCIAILHLSTSSLHFLYYFYYISFYYITHSNFYTLRSKSFINIYYILLLIHNSTYVSCILLNPDLPLICLSTSILDFPSYFHFANLLFRNLYLLQFSIISSTHYAHYLIKYPSITP